MKISKKYSSLIFGLVMSFLMSLVMSFALLAINVGFVPNFFIMWFNSFIVGFIVATPTAFVAVPIAGKVVGWATREAPQ